MQVFTPTLASSPLVEGIISWAIPLVVFLAVLLWLFLLLLRHHPQ
jgi:hypothetical protein